MPIEPCCPPSHFLILFFPFPCVMQLLFDHIRRPEWSKDDLDEDGSSEMPMPEEIRFRLVAKAVRLLVRALLFKK